MRFRPRKYARWRSLWEGVEKSIVDMLGGPLPTAAAAVAGAVTWKGRTYP
jgi:hypothetical protein